MIDILFISGKALLTLLSGLFAIGSIAVSAFFWFEHREGLTAEWPTKLFEGVLKSSYPRAILCNILLLWAAIFILVGTVTVMWTGGSVYTR